MKILDELPSLEYQGHIYNARQYEFIKTVLENNKIFITGDLLNDYMLETKYKVWSVGKSDIKSPPYDRAITLYYKNEYPNLYTIKDDEFYLYYKIIKTMVDRKLVKSFNKVRVICRHSVPMCYEKIKSEKISNEIGPKDFEVFCNVYSNTVFFSSATVNSNRFGSRSIISRNIYDIKKNIPGTHVLFDYIFCPIDQTKHYTDGDEFIWQDNTRSTYHLKYGSELQKQQSIDLGIKIKDFIACIRKLDNNPLHL